VSLPLVADGVLVGILSLVQPEANADFKPMVDIAREVADELALGMTQARLREQLARDAEKLEHRVIERTTELEQANAELEAFSYSVSHDLRAPLRAIDGFSRILADDFGTELPPEGRRYLDRVSDSARDMGRLIDGLLDFSRLGRRALSETTIDLDAVVRETLADCAPEREGRNVDVTVGELPLILGDRLLVKQVFANLVSNALKFTRDRDPGTVEIGSLEQDGEHVVYVRDNGVGFDMRHADKLFGVFQRLHRADEFEGTGVGLALVARIVGRHGGRIWADGNPGEGACFYLTFGSKEMT
jgi:signal transduction histidine kinase